ncbi:hypothetical protein MSKOL_2263 [Methanosarcina sp. Kolksee]|uniref:hypothetical protein n=1 Tax=Methanosarcina sp. Kolksee TaxID=1434099 RepID=UPI0006156664|nr:hypothetical protein [Methanosarcina sp. Kolksee]AKB48040.1 hypothetical protein MSKOL_2263 [Methanosarcina sp. Kolksee]
MDIMTDLSIKIAEAVVPDEIDLAPLMTEAFVRGGKERESLFIKQESSGLGAFGLTDGVLLFPWILKGIAVTAPFMSHFLSMDDRYLEETYHFLGISHFLGLFGKETKEQANQLPEKYVKPLTNLFETFVSELEASGLPEEQRERLIANVLVTLRKNSSVSLEFVERVAASK